MPLHPESARLNLENCGFEMPVVVASRMPGPKQNPQFSGWLHAHAEKSRASLNLSRFVDEDRGNGCSEAKNDSV